MVKFFAWRFGRHIDDEWLMRWLDGELPPDGARRVARHLDECEICRGRFQELNQTLCLLHEHRSGIRNAPDTLLRKFEIRLQEEAEKTAPLQKERTSRISRRVAWATALSAACLTLAVAMPGDTARALFRHIWNPLLERSSTKGAVAAQHLPPPAAPTRALVASRALPERASVAVRQVRPSPAEKEAAEVDARWALHRVRACMGEQIDYLQDSQGYVLVRALVDTDARKREIENALVGIRWLHARIRTIEESLREASPSPHAVASSFANTTIPRNTANLAGRRKLKVPENLSHDRILEISRQAVADSAVSMQHAWAVRRIINAYPDERLARLPAESRRKLMSMLLDHATEWQHTLASLKESVRPMLDLEIADPGNAAEETPGSIDSLFTQAEQIDSLTRSLFADSDEPSLDPALAVPGFYSQLSGLATSLTSPQITSLLSTWNRCGQRAAGCRAEASR